MAEKKFYQYYDIVRTFSICLVIMGHSCNSWMKWDQPITNFSTAFIHLVYCICSMCNVTFFMISGALLLKSKKNTSPKAVLKGRVPRVLIPALFWGLIYVAYFATDCFTARPNAYRLGLAIDMIKNCLSVPWSSHLWFIYTIITFYVILPVLCTIIQNISKRGLQYFLVLWFIVGGAFPLMSEFFDWFTMPDIAAINLLNGYVGIFVLGYYLDNYVKKIKLRLCALLFVVTLTIYVSSVIYYINNFGEYPPIHHYYSPTNLINAGCVFMFIKEFFRRKPLSEKAFGVVRQLSALSFGVYFCHEFVRITVQHTLQPMGVHPLIILFANFTISFIVAYGFTFFLSKIPYVSYITLGLDVKKK